MRGFFSDSHNLGMMQKSHFNVDTFDPDKF